MQHAKAILESADKYRKAVKKASPVDQAAALNEFSASLSQFVLDVMKEQKKHKGLQARAVFK